MAKTQQGSGGGWQFGALPFRLVEEGRLEFLLVTSRGTGQWVIPKGNPMLFKKKRVAPHLVAALEAEQEAGITGKISNHPLGFVPYLKRIDESSVERRRLLIFLLRVDGEQDHWREHTQRTRKWFSRDETAALLDSNTNFPDKKGMSPLLKKAEDGILKKASRAVRRKSNTKLRKPHRAAAPG